MGKGQRSKPLSPAQERVLAKFKPGCAIYSAHPQDRSADALLSRGILAVVPEGYVNAYHAAIAELWAQAGIACAREKDFWGAASAFHTAATVGGLHEYGHRWLCLAGPEADYTEAAAVEHAAIYWRSYWQERTPPEPAAAPEAVR